MSLTCSHCPCTADTHYQMCKKFYLFEPICTAVLLSMCGVAHAVRISAIFDKSIAVLGVLGAGTFAMATAMGVGSAFYRREYISLCSRAVYARVLSSEMLLSEDISVRFPITSSLGS